MVDITRFGPLFTGASPSPACRAQTLSPPLPPPPPPPPLSEAPCICCSHSRTLTPLFCCRNRLEN